MKTKANELMGRKKIFNEHGDIKLTNRRMIGGNTTNLNDFNNIKYPWAMDLYRTMMNAFWIPEEISMSQDVKEYRQLDKYEKTAYDRVLSFLIFLDSVQTVNLPNVADYITAPEVGLNLAIQAFQEAVHSQSYGYILDSIASPEERTNIIYLWKDDEHLLARNKYIGDIYNDFKEDPSKLNFMKVVVANYILEGIYFYSGFMFFYNLGRMGKMSGTVQQIRYINRDENNHLWLFRNIIMELRNENPELFTNEFEDLYRSMIKEAVEQEIAWGKYAIGNDLQGLNEQMIEDYIKYLGNLRSRGLGLGNIYPDNLLEPESMRWVSEYSDPNGVKTDFFEGKVTAYTKGSAVEDDLG